MDRPQAEFDEYEKLVWRMNPPRVIVDNCSCQTATLVKVDSSNRHGILLEVVQIITDLDLWIRKAYISSDGGWFMDVFYVTDASGDKVRNEDTISHIEKGISTSHESTRRNVRSATHHELTETPSTSKHTAIELTGHNRPGLMSEISALLTGMRCNVVAAELWTHNRRVACVLCVNDEETKGPIEDHSKLHKIKDSLSNVLRGHDSSKEARTDFVNSATHTERRLHQMMFADRDYERDSDDDNDDEDLEWDVINEKITVNDCEEKGYSVVNIDCRNQRKLVFDIVCTLTDMQYVVFHATIDSDGDRACQEYYIRHNDGCTLNSQAERRRVINCLRAAIKRRVSEGLKIELCTRDRVGLLSDVTRIFREHGLSVARADVSTSGENAISVFYVTDVSGNHDVDLKVIEAVRKEIGQAVLKVTQLPLHTAPRSPPGSRRQLVSKFSFGNWLGMPSLVLLNLGLIKS